MIAMDVNSERMLELVKTLRDIEVPNNEALSKELGCWLFKSLPRIRGYIETYKYPGFSRKLYLYHVLFTISEDGKMERRYGRPTISQIISDLSAILKRIEDDLKEGRELAKVIRVLESAFD